MEPLSFLEYLNKIDYEARIPLEEKLILYNNGAPYGQIVFVGGGGGSGKGFAIKNFMQGELFKIRDVDALKIAFKKLDELEEFSLKDLLKKYGHKIKEDDMALVQKHVIDKGLSLKDLSLKVPEHVHALHILVRATGMKNKTFDLLLKGASTNNLPNILIDSTLNDMSDFDSYVPKLLNAGYKPTNIHVTWVLTNYKIALENNKNRDRTGPEDVLLQTHRGASQTMFNLIKNGFPNGVYRDWETDRKSTRLNSSH